MPTLLTTDTAVCTEEPPWLPDEAQLAAAAFLTRYNGRTLEAYRQDLRYFFQWATDQHLAVLDSTRAHIEVYRSTMEQRGLAASTIDRRLSTVCGYYRFAHIDGRISANPAQYVRRPKVPPAEQHAMDRGELGRFLFAAEHFDRAHGALAVLLGLNGLRVSEACATNIEGLGFERGHRTLRIMGKGSKPAAGNRVHRTYHRFTDVVLERAHLRTRRGIAGEAARLQPMMTVTSDTGLWTIKVEYPGSCPSWPYTCGALCAMPMP